MNKAAHRIYAVGDIHGEFEQLQDAISKIESDGGRDSPVVFLGDYIDRGPQSRDVIEYLIEGLEAGRNWVCLMGNHDRMFRMFMEATPRADPRLRPEYHWLHDRLGGKETLRSYGVNVANTENLQDIHHQARVAIPKTHLEFLDSLKYSLEQQKLFFVHAGIRPGVPFKEQDMDDLIWIRQEFHEDTRLFNS